MEYLDFEKPIEELELQLAKAKDLEKETDTDMSKSVKELETRIAKTKKELYKNLNAWQRVQMSRHPQRPYTLAYIEAMTNGAFIEYAL